MTNTPARSRFLEQAMLWNLLIHAAAVLSMATVLTRAVPGGPVADDAARVAFIAEHPGLWRLGWAPWHLCAAIDVVTGAALVWTRWVPRGPAVLTLLVTLCAVVPEQVAEVGWVTRGVELAQEAHATGDLREYLAYEAWAFRLTVEVAASIYVFMALGWTWCLAAGGAWSPALTGVSALAWPTLAVGSLGLLLPAPLRPGPPLVAASTGLGFALLLVWLALATRAVWRRGRADAPAP